MESAMVSRENKENATGTTEDLVASSVSDRATQNSNTTNKSLKNHEIQIDDRSATIIEKPSLKKVKDSISAYNDDKDIFDKVTERPLERLLKSSTLTPIKATTNARNIDKNMERTIEPITQSTKRIFKIINVEYTTATGEPKNYESQTESRSGHEEANTRGNFKNDSDDEILSNLDVTVYDLDDGDMNIITSKVFTEKTTETTNKRKTERNFKEIRSSKQRPFHYLNQLTITTPTTDINILTNKPFARREDHLKVQQRSKTKVITPSKNIKNASAEVHVIETTSDIEDLVKNLPYRASFKHRKFLSTKETDEDSLGEEFGTFSHKNVLIKNSNSVQDSQHKVLRTTDTRRRPNLINNSVKSDSFEGETDQYRKILKNDRKRQPQNTLNATLYANDTNKNHSLLSLNANSDNTNFSSLVANYFNRTKISLISKSNKSKNESIEQTEKSIYSDDSVYEMEDDVYSSLVNNDDDDKKGNEVNSNRRFQRYQFNRSRTTTPRITTTTTTESTTTTISHEDDSIQSIDQVNKFDDASITTIGTNSTESTLGSRPPASRSRRIKVLRYRRPVGSNNTTLINSSNNSITSVTNITDTTLDLDNTDSLSFDRNVENSQPEILNNTRHLETTPTETEIPETPSYVTPPTTKRFRKIVRRLKRPLFNQSSTPDNVPDEFTTRAAVTVQTSTVAPTTAAGFKRRKESRYNFNRNKPSQDKNQQINQEEINAGQKIPPRFSPSSRRTGSERKNIASRTPLFSKGNRVRFNSRGPTSTETTNTEPVEKHEEKKTTSKAVEETEDDHGDHEGHTTEYVLENNVTNFEISLKEEDVRVSATDSTTNGEQPKVTTSEKGSEDDLVEMTTEQSVDDLKTEPNVKEVYQNKTSNEENNLQTILDQSKNTDQMNFGNTRFSSVPENETDSSPSINVTDEHKHTEVTTSRENLDLQKIRNKVKSAQLKPNANDKEEGVINKSLKKLLLEKQVKKANVGEDDDESYELEATTHYDVDARTTTAELLADEKILSTASATRSNDDEVTTNKTLKDDSTTKVTSNTLEGKDSVEATDETKKDDELKEVETTSITPETTPSMGSEFVKSSINETVQNNELKEIRSTADANILILTSTSATDIAEPNNGLQLDTTEEAVADYSTTTINPLVRRRFMPSSKKKKTGKELNTVQENPDEAPSTFRPTPKRKLVDKRPYIPRKPTLSLISTTPRVTATKTRNKFVPRKFGQFQPPSNIGSSQGNSKNSQLPGVNRFKDNHLSPKHQEEDENVEDEDEYEDDSDPEDDENEENKPMESSGKKSNEQTSKEYEDDDEDGEEDEDDEDYDGEDNDKHLENSDSHETVAGHRVPPGSRPGKSSTNVPFNPRNRQSPSLPNNANRARVVNRPVLSIAKPVKLEFEPSTLPTVTKPAPFIPSHTPTYERKYSGSSTTDSSEISAADDSLEDLNIEAINARNKKIFDINSKKHTTLKPKLFTNHDSSEQDSDEQEPQKQIITTHQQPTNTETITKTEDKVESVDGVNQHNNNTYYEGREYGFITTTPSTPTTHLNTDLTFPTSNEISPQDIDDSGRAQQMPTTTVPPTTTLLHVFTLTDDDGHTNRPIAASDNFIPSESDTVEPKHKVVEINRIVEITSKEDKLRRKSKANQGLSYETVGSTSLKVESLPHLEQLGEISVVKYVHLVNGDDITIDGHSAVADYTPTESSATAPAESTSRRSPPVRNSVPEEVIERHEYVRAASERKAKSLVPEVILEAIETSTIPLEGLFDSARKGKELNASENVVYDYKSSQAPSNELRDSTKGSPIIGTGQQNAPSSTYDAADHASAKPSTVAAALFPAYVRPIVPLLRPESNESSPLVISIANLDKVILSKVGKVNAFQPASDSSAESSSSHVAIIKPPTNHFQAQTIDGKSSGSGGYSSASSVGDVSHSSDAINSNSNDSFNTNPSYNNSTTNNDIGTSVNTDSNNRIQNRLSTVNGSSSISEEVSFSSESHVVHEHKTRKHKSKKSQHFSKNTESSSSETIAEKMTTSRAI